MTFFLTRWFYAMMQFFYGLFNNSYLLTIVVSTVILRLIQLFPDISDEKARHKHAYKLPAAAFDAASVLLLPQCFPRMGQ